jgi:hypothetical protein
VLWKVIIAASTAWQIQGFIGHGKVRSFKTQVLRMLNGSVLFTTLNIVFIVTNFICLAQYSL